MASSSSPDAPAAGGTGLPPRQSAWRVLQSVAAGAWADVALERELARQPLSPLDRALATELAYGCVRQRRLLDAWIDALGAVPAARQPPQLRWLLHLGLYQLLFSDRVPAAAAVSTTVELARRGGLDRLAPVANGLLRSVLRARERAAVPGAVAGAALAEDPCRGLVLPADPVVAFGVRHSLPDWLVALLHEWRTPPRAEAFARACNAPPPLDLRVNRLAAGRDAVLEALSAAGVAAAALPDLPDGLTLLERSGNVCSLPGYARGWWSVQDRSAQRIAPLLQPRPGERLLDACAAPGGKSTQLAEWLGGEGEVWAVDRAASRLKRLRSNAERLGLTTIQVLEADATALAQQHPEWRGSFRGILVDAPCSGLGTLARHADARWRIEPGAIEEMLSLQDRLLDGVADLLAPGGRLVYATCSVHPLENGERVSGFLARRPLWRLESQRQWWPGDPEGGDGFYAAVLRQTA
ncbi:MAG: 16S rRNA (cytosine(967)-C(5))-methyltransferase [Cyanobium sp.]